MTKPKVIVYSYELPDCPCYKKIFAEFEILLADSEEEFSEKIRSLSADAAVICFCSCSDKDVEKLPLLNALTGPIPLFACLKSSDPDFTFHAGQAGIEDFLQCTGNVEEIRERIHQAIRKAGLKKHLESRYPGCLARSTYSRKITEIIVQNFPQRIKEKDIAKKLGISCRWLYSQIVQTFGISYSRLTRRIWVYQALLLMKNTLLDNTDIALELNYTEETNMARDFRKELVCSPHEARRLLLLGKEPEDLLN